MSEHHHDFRPRWLCECLLAEGVRHAYVCGKGRTVYVCACGETGYAIGGEAAGAPVAERVGE